MKRGATMADVAHLAGVGKMTVSRVLSGQVNVSEETTERVQRAISMLNYQPNELARSLRAVHSKTIAVILPFLNDPFFATCAHGVSTIANQKGYSVLLTTANEDEAQERKQLTLMVGRRVDGIILIPALDVQNYLLEEPFIQQHIVLLDRPSSDICRDAVLVNNRAGAAAAVQHLLDHGHKRVQFFGLHYFLFTMKTRYAGYRDTMQKAGLVVGKFLECSEEEQTIELVRQVLSEENPPTAFFSSNNVTTRLLLHAFMALKIRVPEDIAFVGFDDFDVADVLQPSLTVVRQPVEQIGEVGAELLFKRIESGQISTKGKRITLPLQLVIRRSCGCGDDSLQHSEQIN